MAKTLKLFDEERNSLASQGKTIPYSLVTWHVDQSTVSSFFVLCFLLLL